MKAQTTNLKQIKGSGKAEYKRRFFNEQKPLFIVNGVELQEYQISSFDPKDIESIDIIKDNSGIKIFGKKAEYGVVIIKVKKEKFSKYESLLKSKVYAQKTTLTYDLDKNQFNMIVSGVVKDCEKLSLPGADIFVKGTKEKTITNLDGEFRINANINDTLLFSYTGFETKEIVVKNNDTINVFLKELKNPKDVIVIAKKPVIYLYPTEKTDISINIDFNGKLLTTFPKYDENWNLTAYPDGRIFDKKTNRFYSSLFWDGKQNFPTEHYNYQSGFIVSKNDLTAFLIEKLEYIGLNTTETNEFVQFWLPILEKNETNFIHFYVNSEYDVISKNTILPKPDTEIRVFIEFHGLNIPIKITEQKLQKTQRKGFTVVEWGGSDVSEPINELKKLKL